MDNRVETLVAREQVRIFEEFLDELKEMCLVDNVLTDQMVEDLLVEFALGHIEIDTDTEMFEKLAIHTGFADTDEFFEAIVERIQGDLKRWAMDTNLPSVWNAWMRRAYVNCVIEWTKDNRGSSYPEQVVDAVESLMDNYNEDIHEEVPVSSRVFYNRHNSITGDVYEHVPTVDFDEALELLEYWRREIESNLDSVSVDVYDIPTARFAFEEIVNTALISMTYPALEEVVEHVITESEEWIPLFMQHLNELQIKHLQSMSFAL